MKNGAIPFSMLWLSAADYLTETAVELIKCIKFNMKKYRER